MYGCPPSQTVHIIKSCFEVILHIDRLGNKFILHLVPAKSHSRDWSYTHSCQIRESLQQEVSCDKVIVIPSFHGFNFVHRDVLGVTQQWMKVQAVEETPATAGLHGLLKLNCEDGPVGAIRFKSRDVGGKLFDDGSGRRQCGCRGRQSRGGGR